MIIQKVSLQYAAYRESFYKSITNLVEYSCKLDFNYQLLIHTMDSLDRTMHVVEIPSFYPDEIPLYFSLNLYSSVQMLPKELKEGILAMVDLQTLTMTSLMCRAWYITS